MCATCVAQGVTYVGSALVGLQVMAARARAKRAGGGADGPDGPESPTEPVATTDVSADGPPAPELAECRR